MQFLENKINLLFEVSGTVLGDAGCGVRVCVLAPVCDAHARASESESLHALASHTRAEWCLGVWWAIPTASKILRLVKECCFENGDFNKLLRITKLQTDRVRERVAKAFYKLAQQRTCVALPSWGMNDSERGSGSYSCAWHPAQCVPGQD